MIFRFDSRGLLSWCRISSWCHISPFSSFILLRMVPVSLFTQILPFRFSKGIWCRISRDSAVSLILGMLSEPQFGQLTPFSLAFHAFHGTSPARVCLVSYRKSLSSSSSTHNHPKETFLSRNVFYSSQLKYRYTLCRRLVSETQVLRSLDFNACVYFNLNIGIDTDVNVGVDLIPTRIQNLALTLASAGRFKHRDCLGLAAVFHFNFNISFDINHNDIFTANSTLEFAIYSS